jgi:glycosyltransferase involved in cell wall biosynthesis
MQKILLISRKYPPSIGGMQSYTAGLVRHLKNYYEVDTILLGRGQFNLFWFLPYAFFKALFLCLQKKYDLLYICDALLAPLGVLIGSIYKIKKIITVHGLDITYGNFVYQKIIPASVKKFNQVVCVSVNTLTECVKRGIPEFRCVFIPNGLDLEKHYLGLALDECRMKLSERIGFALRGKKILFSCGRLIERKGLPWFIENVFTKLGDNYLYFIAGNGPLKSRLRGIIAKLSLEDRVKLVGLIDEGLLKLFYNSADIFVLPNQAIKDDPEGFGIVAIEAASCGLTVVANDIEGLSQAVLNGKTGWLIPYNNIGGFLEKINHPALERLQVRQEAAYFSWARLIKQYQNIIDSI